MTVLSFIERAERTDFSDECYGAFVRDLYVAQQFEVNCRALITLLNIKKKVRFVNKICSPDDPEFLKFVNDLWKRSLGENLLLLRNYGFPIEINTTLVKAKKARNAIAHEITLGIEQKIEQDHGRQEVLNNISTYVRHIAEGDSIIGFLIQHATNEPCPSHSYLKDYPNKVVKWVCETL